MVLVPVMAPVDSLSSPERPTQGKSAPVLFLRQGISPGVRLLVTDMLRGCTYRMTSYESRNIADVDPVYGLQLTHPRFPEFIGDRHDC